MGGPAFSGAQVTYPLRYDGRQIFYGRAPPMGVLNEEELDASQAPKNRFHPHERRNEGKGESKKCEVGKDGHFNPLRGGFCTDIVSTFKDPDTKAMEWWLWMIPFITGGIAGFIALVQFGCDAWFARKRALRRQDFFDKLDSDKTGTLDFFEIVSGLKKRGFSENEIRIMFNALDLNKCVL